MIPVANPQAQVSALRTEIDKAISKFLSGNVYILGSEVSAFEQEFASYLGALFACGVANGTDAIRLALMAVGVQAGDEVITVSHSAVATVAAIVEVGAVPVMVDIDPQTYCIDIAAIRSAITPKTRAIVPVHIYGHPADMLSIMQLAKEFNLKVVEDCAQAHGASILGKKIGTFGDAAAFSFYPTKNLGALGDGGAVVCQDPIINERVKNLRQYGWKTRYISDCHGINSRLDEIQAAILRVKLKYLETGNQRRREIGAQYSAALSNSGVIAPYTCEGVKHAMHLYVVQSKNRDALSVYLREEGIATALHYPAAIHQQAAYRIEASLVQTESIYKNILSLPMFPELSEAQVEYICQVLRVWDKD